VEVLVADEVEDRAMLSLHCMAEQLVVWQQYAEVGVTSTPTSVTGTRLKEKESLWGSEVQQSHI